MSNETGRRTPEEIAALKRRWATDPCWDIEDTYGFEAHRGELITYRLEIEQERRQQAASTAARWGATVELVRCIDALESRVKKLEERLDGR